MHRARDAAASLPAAIVKALTTEERVRRLEDAVVDLILMVAIVLGVVLASWIVLAFRG